MSGFCDEEVARIVARRAVAEAAMQLVAEGVLPRTPDVVRQIATALGIDVAELKAAWLRIERSGYRPPPAKAGDTAAYMGRFDKEGTEPVAAQQRDASRSTRRYKEANPTPGMRMCRRCGEVQPVENFPIKDHASGRRRSYDSDCWKAMQRERYLSVKREKALNAVGLRFVLTEGDDVYGSLACMECGVPLKAGDQVEGRHVTLRHVDCEEAQISWLHRKAS